MSETCPDCKRGNLISLGANKEHFSESNLRETIEGERIVVRYRCPICKKYTKQELSRKVEKVIPLSNHKKRTFNREIQAKKDYKKKVINGDYEYS